MLLLFGMCTRLEKSSDSVNASYTRAQVQDNVITLRYVFSELRLADFFTKAHMRFMRVQHRFYLSKLSVIDPP
jgi:hypothetical protein